MENQRQLVDNRASVKEQLLSSVWQSKAVRLAFALLPKALQQLHQPSGDFQTPILACHADVLNQ